MRRRNLIYLAIFLHILSGCSIPIRYYLRNYSNKTAVIEFYLNKREINKNSSNKVYTFNYSPSILPIKFELLSLLEKTENLKLKYDSTIELNAPSKTTFYLGSGINFIHEYFEKMVIAEETGSDTILFSSKKFVVKREGISRYSAYYDIK